MDVVTTVRRGIVLLLMLPAGASAHARVRLLSHHAAWQSPTSTVDLLNDLTHPYSARTFAHMRDWIARSTEPTVNTSVTATHSECPDGGSTDCAGDHQVWLLQPDRFALMHELGHEADFYDWTPAFRTRLTADLGMRPQLWDSTAGRPPMEVAADAYAECSLHRHWSSPWWGHYVGRGRREYVDTPTPYDFRANRAQFERICADFRHAMR